MRTVLVRLSVLLSPIPDRRMPHACCWGDWACETIAPAVTTMAKVQTSNVNAFMCRHLWPGYLVLKSRVTGSVHPATRFGRPERVVITTRVSRRSPSISKTSFLRTQRRTTLVTAICRATRHLRHRQCVQHRTGLPVLASAVRIFIGTRRVSWRSRITPTTSRKQPENVI